MRTTSTQRNQDLEQLARQLRTIDENKMDEIKEEASDRLEERIKDEMGDLNKALDIILKDLYFQLHDGSERLYVQVVDRVTDEVINEIPPRDFLDLLARLQKMVGIFLDEIA